MKIATALASDVSEAAREERIARAARTISRRRRRTFSRACGCCASWLPLDGELRGHVGDARYSARGWVLHKPSTVSAARMQQGGAPDRERPLHPMFATRESYLMCLLTSFVISNIETCFLPPNTGPSLSSALMLRRSFASWQAVPLDVLPELLRDLGAGERTVADDRGERRVRLHRLHERGVRRALLLRGSLLRGSSSPSSSCSPSSRPSSHCSSFL